MSIEENQGSSGRGFKGSSVIAYHTYGKYLAKKIFKLNPEAVCPSTVLRDDIDFIPTQKPALF